MIIFKQCTSNIVFGISIDEEFIQKRQILMLDCCDKLTCLNFRQLLKFYFYNDYFLFMLDNCKKCAILQTTRT